MNKARQTPCIKCPLKDCAAFRPTDPPELDFIQALKIAELSADAGANILAEGTSTPHLFTVLSGWAFRYKMLEDGRRQILDFVLPGDLIGLQASIMGNMEHSIETLSEMVLCVFPRERLWTLYEKYPSLAFDITWLAARSERSIDENLLSVGRRSAPERVAYVLLSIFNRAKSLGLTNGRKLKCPFTQQHLADALGMSLVHTNKTLNSLVRQRLFRWKNGEVEILDEERMAEVAHYDEPPARPRPLI